MIITIDTTVELSDHDKQILSVLVGGSTPVSQPAKAAPAQPKETPAPKAEKAVEPEPEPEDEDVLAEGPTMKDAVALATKMVSAGKAKEVKTALGELGAKRVSELAESDVAAFIDALS